MRFMQRRYRESLERVEGQLEELFREMSHSEQKEFLYLITGWCLERYESLKIEAGLEYQDYEELEY